MSKEPTLLLRQCELRREAELKVAWVESSKAHLGMVDDEGWAVVIPYHRIVARSLASGRMRTMGWV